MRFARLALVGLLATGCSLADIKRIDNADDLVVGQVAAARKQLEVSAKAKDKFDFVVIGDSRGGLDILRHQMREINALNPAFVLYTGDLVGEGTEQEYKEGLAVLKSIKAPVFPALGNHERRNGGIQWYYKYFGKDADYSFDHGKWRFVSLDNSTGAVSSGQLSWLQVQLATPGHKIVFAHEPPPIGVWRVHAFQGNQKEFVKIVADAKVDACLFGHIHIYDRTVKDGTLMVVSGGGGAPLYRLPIFNSREGGAFYHYVIGHAGPDGVTFEVKRSATEFNPTFATEEDPT